MAGGQARISVVLHLVSWFVHAPSDEKEMADGVRSCGYGGCKKLQASHVS